MSDCCGTGDFINVGGWDTLDYCNELELNCKMWIDYNLLKMGAWEDVDPSSPKCDSDYYTLKPVPDMDPSETTKAWAVDQDEIVWENQTYEARTTQPVVIRDGNNADVTAQFDVDYQRGMFVQRVDGATFTEPLTASYSHRSVSVYTSLFAGWWRELITTAFDIDNNTFKNILKTNGIQMPAVIVEAGPVVEVVGYELGNQAVQLDRSVNFWIFAPSGYLRNKITSILVAQKYNNFTMFDSDVAEFPISCGKLVNANSFPELSANWPWKCVEITQVNEAAVASPCSGVYLNRVIMNFKMTNPVKT